MSKDNEREHKVPLECPSYQQGTKIDPIVDVVEKELDPPKDTKQTISKALQE